MTREQMEALRVAVDKIISEEFKDLDVIESTICTLAMINCMEYLQGMPIKYKRIVCDVLSRYVNIAEGILK